MRRFRSLLLPPAIVPSRAVGAAAAVGVAVAFAAVSACAPPPAVPTRAESTAGLTVCWHPDEDADLTAGGAGLRTSLETRLGGAGYKLIPRGRCDLRLRWSISTQSKGGDSSFTAVTVVVRGNKDQVIEKIRVERNRGEAPIDKPDLVVIPIVNAMNASAALAAYASSRHRPGASDGGAADPSPDAGVGAPGGSSTDL